MTIRDAFLAGMEIEGISFEDLRCLAREEEPQPGLTLHASLYHNNRENNC